MGIKLLGVILSFHALFCSSFMGIKLLGVILSSQFSAFMERVAEVVILSVCVFLLAWYYLSSNLVSTCNPSEVFMVPVGTLFIPARDNPKSNTKFVCLHS